MNKYQEYILHTLQNQLKAVYAYADSNHIDLNKGLFDDQLNKTEIAEKITIKQAEDITITKYHFFLIHDGIEAVYAKKKREYVPFGNIPLNYHTPYGSRVQTTKNRQTFYYEIDFDNRIDSIKIVFKDHIADDLIVPVKFIEADKEAYYAKKEAERIAELHRKAAVSCARGLNLVNIYFQPCSEKYTKTEITLYRNELMIAKYTIEGEVYFKAISDLAYGDYSFILKQFSAAGELLLETEPTVFSIECPDIYVKNLDYRYR